MKKMSRAATIAAAGLIATTAATATPPRASAAPVAVPQASALKWKECDSSALRVKIGKKTYEVGKVKIERRGNSNLLRVTLKHNQRLVIPNVNIPVNKPLITSTTWRPVQRLNISQPKSNNLSGAFVISVKNSRTGKTVMDSGYTDVTKYLFRATPMRDDGANAPVMALSSASHLRTTISVQQAWSVGGQKNAGKGKRATASTQFRTVCLDTTKRGGGGGSW